MTRTTRNWCATISVWGIFVLVFGFLTVGSFTQQSPTIDEPIHLLGGYSYLKFSDYRINPEHPPLAKAWAALPLLGLKIDDPRPPGAGLSQNSRREPVDRFYPLAHDMFFVRNDAETLFFYGKIQMIFITILLALFVYLWTRELFGFLAAAVSLFLFALDPNILGHSAIIHTDLPFAAVFLIGTYFFARALKQLTWLNLAITSACFGFAVITKFSYVWLLPAWITLAVIKVFSAEPLQTTVGGDRSITNRWTKAALLAACFIGCAVVAYLMVWAAYGFRYAAASGYPQSLQFTDVLPVSSYNAKLLPLVAEYHFLPEAWVYGQLYVMRELARSMYFFGEVSDRGFWSYFPVAFFVKTPLPIILLFLAAIWIWMRKPAERARSLILLVPASICFGAAMVFRLNIGIRHLLPMYPFLFILISGFIAQMWQGGSQVKRTALAFLGIWYLWSSVSAYPHYLSYFNEIAGGPKYGHKILLDSNLDWGQDLKGLKPWLDRHGYKQVQLIYFGAAEPKYYGIDDFYSTQNLTRWSPTASGEIGLPEILVVSANFLYGGELFLPAELAARLKPYAVREPVGSIGYSLLIFRLNLADAKVYEDAASITARKGAVRLSESLLQKALQLNPASADARYQQGLLMSQQGKFSEAIESFETAIKLEPRHEKAHFSLANALIREQQFDDALRHYREAVKIRPNFAEAYYSLGRVYAARGRTVEAIEHFREALRAKPELAEAHENLAQALARQGRADEAAQHYQEALRILKQRREAGTSRP